MLPPLRNLRCGGLSVLTDHTERRKSRWKVFTCHEYFNSKGKKKLSTMMLVNGEKRFLLLLLLLHFWHDFLHDSSTVLPLFWCNVNNDKLVRITRMSGCARDKWIVYGEPYCFYCVVVVFIFHKRFPMVNAAMHGCINSIRDFILFYLENMPVMKNTALTLAGKHFKILEFSLWFMYKFVLWFDVN